MGYNETTYRLREDGMYEVYHSYTSYKGMSAGSTSTSFNRVITAEEHKKIIEKEESEQSRWNYIFDIF